MSKLDQLTLKATETLSGEFEIRDDSKPLSMHFENHDGKVIMTITGDNKIKFNQEEFPDLAADDFARETIKILEELKELHLGKPIADWRSMKTPPKDYDDVLLCVVVNGGKIATMGYGLEDCDEDGNDVVNYFSFHEELVKPLAWMPLPEVPNE